MTEWKLVPVEPDENIVNAALEYDVFDGLRRAAPIVGRSIYRAMLAAAPTPPVVLPPLSKGINDRIKEFANACAFGGRDERVEADMALTREIRSYARAALAQYGIKEQSDE